MDFAKVMLIIFCILFYSCNNGKRNEIKSTEDLKKCIIDVDKAKEFIDISDLFEDEIEITPLETNENCLISDILKIQYFDDFIYISDRTAQCVFQFDKFGKLVKKIGQRGEGPKEYSSIGNFVVNANYVYIQDLYANKILQYNIHDNSIVPYILKIDNYVDELIDFERVLYCISNNKKSEKNNFNLYKIDRKTEKIEFLLPADDRIVENRSAWGLNRFASKYKDSALLIYPLNDTIYNVTKDKVFPQFVIQFTNRTLPTELRIKSSTEIMVESSNYILGMDNIRNSGKYIFFDYGDRGLQKNVLINKNSLESQVAERFTLRKWGELYVTSPETAQNEFLILQQAFFFKKMWNGNYSRNKFVNEKYRTQFESLYNKLNDDDNPIVFRLKFRND